MITLENLSPAWWTVVAIKVFDAGHRDLQWDWLCSNRDAGEIITRVRDGRLIQCNRKVADGHYELVVRVPKNAPILDPQKAAERGKPVFGIGRTTTNYDALLEAARKRERTE
jgi:hypothetical protein